jgi:formate dehydrogenase subunit gamma
MTTLSNKRLNGYLLTWGSILLFLLGFAVYLQATGADAANPRANFWRVVRDGIPGYTAVSSQGHDILIQNGGENWREIRNILIIKFSPWILGLALIAMGIFHMIVGGDKLDEPRSGVMIKRHSLGDRLLHWYTALLFIIMAITGLSLLLGRSGLIPLFGHVSIASYLAFAKLVHNWAGPLFLAGVLLEFVLWARNNIPKKRDLYWFKSMGGMLGSGPPPHTGKVNAGEKAWFWLMILFGTAVGITGVLLDFPIWGQDRFIMQVSHVIHATVAVLFVTASFGHIYMGTLGSEGAFEGMWKGKVDKVWAKQHADLWYEKVAEEKMNRQA